MNENAAGIIYSVVEPSIQSLIRDFLDDSVGMWKKLKETYAQENAASRFLILDEFLSVSKGADESLTALCARVEDSLQKVRSAHSKELTLASFEEELAMMALMLKYMLYHLSFIIFRLFYCFTLAPYSYFASTPS